jgi:hypothetical protein
LIRSASVLSLALAATGLGHARDASASLLDEPPKLFTFKLDDASSPRLPLLRAFLNAEIERPGPMRSYLAGPWGKWRGSPWVNLAWSGHEQAVTNESPSFPDTPTLEVQPSDWLRGGSWLQKIDPSFTSPVAVSTGPSLRSNGFDALWEKPVKVIPDWRCRRRPVQFVRYAGEALSFALVRCDGSVAPEALDKLSIITRPTDVANPGKTLPDEPDPESWQKHEWVPGVRLMNPRLLWALQKISDAFPWRTIYVFSGYRPGNKGGSTGSHHSMHAEGRAIDILVQGVPNASVFNVCRTLDDVGCGFYPNSKFVHVDVRKPATGHAFWVDISGPGEKSQYVDAWPGVVERGALVWQAVAGD